MSVRHTLLVVEDCAENRITHRHFLQQVNPQNYHILECKTGEEGLRLCQATQVDGVLLDHYLPDMTGLEFLAAVKGLETKSQGAEPTPVLSPPIILLTSRGDEKIAAQALKQGAVDYLIKEGLTPDRIHCTLQTVIREHQLKQTLWATQVANQGLMTELQEKNQALESSLRTQKAILEAIPDMLIRINRQGIRLELFNQHRVKLINPERFTVGCSLYTVLSKPMADQRLSAIHRALDTQEVQTSEHAIEIGGETRYEETRVVACGPDEALIIIRDITDRKRAELALQTSEQELRGVFSGMEDVVLVFNREGRYLKVAPTRCRQLLTDTPDRLLGKTVHEVFPAPLAQKLVGAICNALDQEKTVDFEYRLLVNGQSHSFNAKVSPIGDDTVVWVARDITELRQSQELYRLLVDNFPNGSALLFDGDLRYRIAGGLGLEAVGLTKDGLEGKTIREAFSPELCDTLEPLYRRTLAGEAIVAEVPYQGKFFLTRHLPVRHEGEAIEFGIVLTQDITEQKQAEAELKQIWTAVEAASDAIAITTLEDGLPIPTYLNSALVQRFGYTLEELMAAGGPALLHLDLPKFQTLVEAALLGQSWMGEVPMQNRAGERLDILLRIDPIKNLQEQMTGLVVIHTDITERCAAEQALQQLNQELETRVLERTEELELANVQLQAEIWQRQHAEGRIRSSEAELRAMTEASPVGIFRTAPGGSITYVNQTLLDICGCSRAEMTNRSWIKMLHPTNRKALLRGWKQLLRGGQEFKDEVHLQRQDGTERWAVVKAVPFYDGSNLLGYVGTLDDISDRKLTEAALADSESRFRSLVENAQDIIYSLNSEGRFTYVSPNWTRILGHPIPEVQGQLFEPFVHPDDLEICWQAFQKLVASGQEQNGLEYRVLHQDSTWRWHVSNLSILTDSPQQAVMIVGVARDITERRQAEQALQITNDQLRRANAELGQATRLKDEFLATISHELRTPLNAIIGLSEGLLEEVYGSFNPKQHKAISTIKRSGRHLLELITDILDLSKIEAGKLELSIHPTLIYPLCEASLALIKPQAELKGIQLTLSMTEALTWIEVDERRTRQILINLLSNAVKFTPAGGSIRLEVRLAETEMGQSNAVLFQIHDTGIGIAAEDLGRLFQPFVQVDTRFARSHGGTGLGLALVRRLTELHKGSVTVTSVKGKGSSFTVRLPLRQSAEYPESLDSVFNRPTSNEKLEDLCYHPQASLPPDLAPLVLLAEDNTANIETIADFLQYEGYRVIFARNGLEAFEQAKQHRPDCILMDVQMPLVDGLEATTRIRNDPALVNIPIIALTAFAMPEDCDRCLQAGMTDYLTKPMGLKHLLAVIQKHLTHA